MIKVLVVDDSAFLRRILTDILETDDEIKVIDTARNGKDALEKIIKVNPDVITLDVEMPIMDGIEALKNIVKHYNIPVIMVSNLTVRGADLTLKALEIGAVDFIPKPKNIFGINGESERKQIVEKVKVAYKSNIKKHDLNVHTNFKFINSPKIDATETFNNVVAIGTSTGGPRALQQIIPYIPLNVDATFLVVQHMPPGFTKSLANRLNSISFLEVKEGEDGEKLKRGYCYIAPGDYHMTVVQKENKDLFLKLDKKQPVLRHRPSVDVLMQSVSEIEKLNKIGIILTGMGSDGAKGITKIKNEKGFTIAQNENSCIVFGMPKCAINMGGIDKILSLNKIVDEVIKKVGV